LITTPRPAIGARITLRCELLIIQTRRHGSWWLTNLCAFAHVSPTRRPEFGQDVVFNIHPACSQPVGFSSSSVTATVVSTSTLGSEAPV